MYASLKKKKTIVTLSKYNKSFPDFTPQRRMFKKSFEIVSLCIWTTDLTESVGISPIDVHHLLNTLLWLVSLYTNKALI